MYIDQAPQALALRWAKINRTIRGSFYADLRKIVLICLVFTIEKQINLALL